jgi:uncharacterized protein YhhL (DUF1145 family)
MISASTSWVAFFVLYCIACNPAASALIYCVILVLLLNSPNPAFKKYTVYVQLAGGVLVLVLAFRELVIIASL